MADAGETGSYSNRILFDFVKHFLSSSSLHVCQKWCLCISAILSNIGYLLDTIEETGSVMGAVSLSLDLELVAGGRGSGLVGRVRVGARAGFPAVALRPERRSEQRHERLAGVH